MAKKYSKKASEKIGTVMREFKKGSLHSGKSKEIVTNPAQAKAIAISEARERGFKVPSRKRRRNYGGSVVAKARGMTA